MPWFNPSARKNKKRTLEKEPPRNKTNKTREVGNIEVREMESMDTPSTILPRSSDDRHFVSQTRKVQHRTAESM